jgi:hippurate hydrolase
VVGVLKNGKGPTVMLRGDMDALPIKEETGATYASKVISKDERGNKVGVMHACGHDLHMTSLIGAARLLARQRDRWSGTVVAVAQPAEERGRGSQLMLDAGLFKRFGRPDYALALHADAGLAAGQIGFAEGPYNASIDSVDITVRGAGGHGAYPHTTRDPVVIAARLVVALQTIVSREVDPVEPAVVTVGTIHGGTKRNVIPEQVKLELTVRCHSDQVRQQVLAAIRREAEHTARAAGLSEQRLPVVEVKGSLPAVYNDPPLVRRSVAAMRAALGEARVQPRRPTMGGENFSLFGRTEPRVPIFMFRLGTVDPQLMARAEAKGEQLPGLHSPRFLPEPKASIRTGVTAMSAAALELLRAP